MCWFFFWISANLYQNLRGLRWVLCRWSCLMEGSCCSLHDDLKIVKYWLSLQIFHSVILSPVVPPWYEPHPRNRPSRRWYPCLPCRSATMCIYMLPLLFVFLSPPATSYPLFLPPPPTPSLTPFSNLFSPPLSPSLPLIPLKYMGWK